MESDEPLHLHDDAQIEEGEDESGLAIPRRLKLPGNLYLVGTVNVDETTYMFSPKVLDRAFTIELNHVDLAGYSTLGGSATTGASDVDLPVFTGLDGQWRRPGESDWRAFGALDGGRFRSWLLRLNELLAGENRHFGYRVANEIARFVTLAHQQAGKDDGAALAAFDLAVLEKVLPKLNGTQQELHALLGQLVAFAIDPSGEREVKAADWELRAGIPWRKGNESGEPVDPVLPRTAAKLLRMLDRLLRRGFVSYIE